MMDSLVLAFDEIGRDDIQAVGGKGANLGELTKAGFDVPPGFCLSTSAFDAFMDATTADIYPRLDGVSPDDLDHLRVVGHSIRSHLRGIALPAAVEQAVVTAWQHLGENHAYAVRSSATAEDLPHASFAGQQDTFLNVRGKHSLLAKVKDCLISLFTDRAILYRVQNGFDHRRVAIAVIVQKMVQPDVSGILFTADPITGNRNRVSIDASFGLGEALVSGIVSADLYQVDKQKLSISKQQIAAKKVAIRALPEGGTEQVEVEADLRCRKALTDDQIIALAMLGSKVEAHYGKPQDIEWALEGNTLHITQSRPITSLYPLPEPAPEDDSLHVYFSLSHFQVMTNAMPPLSLSVLRTLIPVGHKTGQIETSSVQTAGGRLYADLASILRHPVGQRMLLTAFENADQLAVGALSNLVKRSDFLTRGDRFNPLRMVPALLPHLIKSIGMLLWGRPEGVPQKALAFMDDYMQSIASKMDAVHELPEQINLAVKALHRLSKPVLTWLPHWIAGMAAGVLLKKIIPKKADPNDWVAIERGLKGNVATDMNLAVGDLAVAARASDRVARRLSQTNRGAEARIAGLKEFAEGRTFLKTWHAFLRTYGARGPSEIDLSRPRWSEDPSSLLQMVVNAMGRNPIGSHRMHYQKLIVEGNQAARNLMAAAYKGRLGWLQGRLAKRLIRIYRHLAPLREHHKFLAIRLLSKLKTVLLKAGDQLAESGRIDASADIWFLTVPEVMDAFISDKNEFKRLISKRRSEFEHHQQLTPPRVITSEGEVPVVQLERAEAPDGALIGSPVSAGVVEGIAKVVLDPSVEALNPGEILVAPFTDPGWTPLFVNAAGLVTEVGGMMTHGSVVAREYGIPAVVGVVDATKLIKTGQRIRVHGDTGTIVSVHA